MLTEAQRDMRKRTLVAIESHSKEIDPFCKPLDLHPIRLIKAFAAQESSFGSDLGDDGMIRRKIELAYAPDGKYYKRSLELQAGFAKWGVDAASSHGPWQTLWATAIRFGWPEDRQAKELGNPEENVRVFAKIVIHELKFITYHRMNGISPRYITVDPLDLLADAYNSGNARDQIIPSGYIASVCKYYELATETEDYP